MRDVLQQLGIISKLEGNSVKLELQSSVTTSSSPPSDHSPDRMSVHHHHQLVKRLGQVRGQLGRVLQRLLAGEVEDILLGNIVVYHGDTVVVAHKGGHGGGSPVDRVGVVGLSAGLHQQRADLRLGSETGEVETRVIVFVITPIRVSTCNTCIILHSTHLKSLHLV